MDKSMQRRISRRRILLAGLAGGFAAAAAPARAQSWWDRARKLVEDLTGGGAADGALTAADAAAGLREALNLGVRRTIERVGRPDGYFADAAIHIPLPSGWARAQSALGAVGLSGLLDDLELRLNRAAETAAPLASDIFMGAIRDMTIADAIEIVRGPDDAATRYFETRMTPPLKTAFRPVIETELEGAGAMGVYDRIQARVANLPLAGDVAASERGDLVDHGLDFALAGLFHYLAVEEAAIRNDPAKRTSEILRRVFG